MPNFKYALITNEFDSDLGLTNRDIPIGGFRPLDLAKSPYNLTSLTVLLDYTYAGDQKKRVYLYSNPQNTLQLSLND